MRFIRAATAVATGAMLAASLISNASSAAAGEYTDELLTADQVKAAVKYDGTLEAMPVTSQKNSSVAVYRDPTTQGSGLQYSVNVYKYVVPKPATKPAKPDPNAPKSECRTIESNGASYTGVCWSKTYVSAFSSTKVGKMIVSTSVYNAKYGPDGQQMPVRSTSKQRAEMARDAKAMRNAQLKKLGWS